MFERYVNFEFYKTLIFPSASQEGFERYVNFEFYKTHHLSKFTLFGLRDM